ncbi:hypothetical protein GMRT_12878 [Giardia muris]|uniref:Uncharacterized protein n=1 Tax=Giardia muris TaxID=5742 RepID=A0A4Z1T122_GIAMU|nr:hypothetical protein GMRT_12878 [Giardia muris]|eukprot:TNJ27603.1 hypothetical protein GMRT_12878 [Giardia muris]
MQNPGGQDVWVKLGAAPRGLRFTPDGWAELGADAGATDLSLLPAASAIYLTDSSAGSSGSGLAYDYENAVVYRLAGLRVRESQRLALSEVEDATCCIHDETDYVLTLSRSTCRTYVLAPGRPERLLDKAVVYGRISYLSAVSCAGGLFLLTLEEAGLRLRQLLNTEPGQVAYYANLTVTVALFGAGTGTEASKRLEEALSVSVVHYTFPLFSRFVLVIYSPVTAGPELDDGTEVDVLLSSRLPTDATFLSMSKTARQHAALPLRLLLIDPVGLQAADLPTAQTLHGIDKLMHLVFEFRHAMREQFSDDQLRSRGQKLALTASRLEGFLSGLKPAAPPTDAPGSEPPFPLTKLVSTDIPEIHSLPSRRDAQLLGSSFGPSTELGEIQRLASTLKDPVGPSPGRALKESIAVSPTRLTIPTQYLGGSCKGLAETGELCSLDTSPVTSHASRTGEAETEADDDGVDGIDESTLDLNASGGDSQSEKLLALVGQLSERLSGQEATVTTLAASLRSVEFENAQLRERVAYLEEVCRAEADRPAPLTRNDIGQLKDELTMYAILEITSTFEKLADRVDVEADGLHHRLAAAIVRELESRLQARARTLQDTLATSLGQDLERSLGTIVATLNDTVEELRGDFVTKELLAKVTSSVLDDALSKLEKRMDATQTTLTREINGLKEVVDNLKYRTPQPIAPPDHGEPQPHTPSATGGSTNADTPSRKKKERVSWIDDRPEESRDDGAALRKLEKELNTEVHDLRVQFRLEVDDLAGRLQKLSATVSSLPELSATHIALKNHQGELASAQAEIVSLQTRLHDTEQRLAELAQTCRALRRGSQGPQGLDSSSSSTSAIVSAVLERLDEDYTASIIDQATGAIWKQLRGYVGNEVSTTIDRAVGNGAIGILIDNLITRNYVKLIEKVPGIVLEEVDRTLPSRILELFAAEASPAVTALLPRVLKAVLQSDELLLTVDSRIHVYREPLGEGRLVSLKTELLEELGKDTRHYVKEYIASKVRPALTLDIHAAISRQLDTASLAASKGGGDRVDAEQTGIIMARLQSLEDIIRKQQDRPTTAGEVADEFSKLYLIVEKLQKDQKLAHQIHKEIQKQIDRLGGKGGRDATGQAAEALRQLVADVVARQERLEKKVGTEVNSVRASLEAIDQYIDKLRDRFRTPNMGDTLTVSQLRGDNELSGKPHDYLCAFLCNIARGVQRKLGTHFYGKYIEDSKKCDLRGVIQVIEPLLLDYIEHTRLTLRFDGT